MMDPAKIKYLTQASMALARAAGTVNEALILMECAEVLHTERTFREPVNQRLGPQAAQCASDLVSLCKDIQRYIEEDRNLPEPTMGEIAFESGSPAPSSRNNVSETEGQSDATRKVRDRRWR